jgi:hypothetical protein
MSSIVAGELAIGHHEGVGQPFFAGVNGNAARPNTGCCCQCDRCVVSWSRFGAVALQQNTSR